jgi:two-component system, NarL family, response regulator NreC
MISVVIADDHAVVLAGVRRLLEAERDLVVAGEAAGGEEALRLVRELKPDVLVIDVVMPGVNGLDVARQIAAAEPATRIVFLSMHASEAYVVEALRAGAAAYVVKEASGAEIVAAVRAAAAGQTYFSAPLSPARLESYLAKVAVPQDAAARLTPRERQVLQLAADGRSNAEIARLLGVSRRTVETHRASLRGKLHIHHTSDLLKYALRAGLIRLD